MNDDPKSRAAEVHAKLQAAIERFDFLEAEWQPADNIDRARAERGRDPSGDFLVSLRQEPSPVRVSL